MLRIAVCEDNKSDLSYIERVITQMISIKIDLDVFMKGKELLKTVQEEGKYDVYLLDIKLPDINGIEVAKAIRKDDFTALLVFITSHKEYVFEAFDCVAFNYLLKPVAKEKIEEVLYKADRYFQKNEQMFCYQFNKAHYRILCKDILYFSKAGRRTDIHTLEGIRSCNMTVGNILKAAKEKSFIQISRSCVVNLRYVEKVSGYNIFVDGNKLHIGNTHRDEFKERYGCYLENMNRG